MHARKNLRTPTTSDLLSLWEKVSGRESKDELGTELTPKHI